jgi:hypothetical protein
VSGSAWVSGSACVSDKACVSGSARVSDKACVSGEARVSGSAKLKNTKDHLCIGPIGSRDSYATFTRDQVTAGCFTGTFDEFEAQVKATHKETKNAREYLAALSLARMRFPR